MWFSAEVSLDWEDSWEKEAPALENETPALG